VWIGTANLNPITNPVAVFWDAALTQPAAQPIRTLNGYPSNAGTPARLYVASDYSIRVQNKNGSVVYSALNENALSADGVSFIQAGTGAVVRSAQDKMRDEFSVRDFGGNLATAVSAIGSTKTTLVINDAVTLSANLTIPANITLRFESAGLITITGNARLFINGAVQANRLQQIFSCSLFTNPITASVNGNGLVITAVTSSTVAPGQIVTGVGLRKGIQIFQAYGTTGTGTYALNGYNGIIASRSMTLVSSPVIFGVGAVDAVYPTWFGAVKDGVTDCSVAVNLSVYSQTWGGTVRFPAGGYVVTQPTVLHPGMTVEGDGVNNDHSGSPPPNQVSFMSTIFVTADDVDAFVISERCNQVNIRNLVFSTKNPPYLSGGDYAPFGTNRRAILYEGHAPQGIFGGVIDSCQFFGFTQAILANDSWAPNGDGVGAAGTYWNGTASVTYYDWQINPLDVINCQFVGNTYCILFNANNCDAWRIVDCVFIMPPNGIGVHLLRCGFIKLDNCFAFAGNLTNTEFVNLVGNGAESLDTVTLDNCQAEFCSHFVNFAAGSTNNTPPQINVRNCIHQIDADVYLGSPCEYNSQNNHIMSYIYVQSTGVRVNSINDKFQFLNFVSGPTWEISVVSGDADTIKTYVPSRNPSSVLGPNPRFNGAAINSAPNVQTVDNYAVTVKDVTVIINRATTTTVILPAPSVFPGRRIRVVTRQAQAVLSSQSNITPITGGASTNAILAATAGK
ncbi:MAG: hypothetical protein ING31_10430, partial [Burkholderiales bacterium]|nr:hypothetical protein [Burkholderiales bacterium]